MRTTLLILLALASILAAPAALAAPEEPSVHQSIAVICIDVDPSDPGHPVGVYQCEAPPEP